MLFIRPKKLIFLEDCVVKKAFVVLLITVSFGKGQELVQVKLKTGNTVAGEFVGTYMEYLHLLIGEDINYFKCDDIQSVTKNRIYSFDYDCSKNTVTADILFPPQLNPMTGEWETIIPDLFDSKKRNVFAKEEEKEKLARVEKQASENKKNQKNSTEKPGFDPEKTLKKQLEKTKNNFQEIVNTKVKPTIANVLYEETKEKPYQNKTQTKEKVFSSASGTNSVPLSQKGNKEDLTTYYYEDGSVSLSESEIRRLIKKEVRKELRKALPYEIKKHKEQRQNKIFQNILLGCGAWFLFMIMLS